MTNTYKALFLSHGGGPLPLFGDEGHQEMVSSLEKIASMMAKPDAIVMVSAHWEEHVPTITSGKAPPLIYDYNGFPEEAYKVRYPCPGEPFLAQEIHRLLGKSRINSRLDEERGFDHGVFVPLKIMYPEADIPCVQLSLVSTLDPFKHIEIGRALQRLSFDNVLLIGSGFSFHNIGAFFGADTPDAQKLNDSFEQWLLNTCSSADYSEEEREKMLIDWADAPGARFCHPREEHFVPLHVCYGKTQAPCSEYFELNIMGKKSSMYLW